MSSCPFHPRCYKDAWDADAVIAELGNESGKIFDPVPVEIFPQNIDTIHDIASLYPK